MNETLKSLFAPFYSASFYHDLIAYKKGIGVKFLILASLINMIAVSVVAYEPVSVVLKEQRSLFESLPDTIIQNGEITMDVSAPQKMAFFEEVEGGPLVLMLDTQSPVLPHDELLKKMEDEKISVHVAKNGVTVLSPENSYKESRFYPVEKDANNTITHEKWLQISKMIDQMVVPTMLVVVAFLLFISHLFTAWMGAVILLIIEPLFKIETTFSGLMRLSGAAKVPVAVFFSFLPPFLAGKTVIWFGFAIFGLLAYKKASQTPTPSN